MPQLKYTYYTTECDTQYKLCHKKTVAVIFTNRRKFPTSTKLRLYGEEIEFSESVKYLEVLIDSKLSWKPYIEEKIKKAKKALFAARSTIGKIWGPSPKYAKWAYTGIV
jgi:hypothetical protein